MVTENIVCDGDLILAVGEAQVRLRASANVLLRSSTVFGALLGPHFREGQHAGTAEQPKEIRLHEDDAAAMSDMLNLLHNNPVKGLLLNPTANKILALAVVVDKYDCVEALGLEIQGILLAFPIVRKDLTFAEIVKNLLASYLLKHSWAFKELCGRAIVQSQEPFVTLREEEWAKLFPSNLISALEHKRNAVQQRMTFELPLFGLTPCRSMCNQKTHHIIALQKTFEIPFWPPAFTPHGSWNLLKTFSAIRNINDQTLYSGPCGHRVGTVVVKSASFKQFADDLEGDCMKLCLGCIEAGKMDFTYECKNEAHKADLKAMTGQ